MQWLNHNGILLFLFIFTGCKMNTCWSQTEIVISGKVIDEQGLPVDCAIIKAGDTQTQTNAAGLFFFKNRTLPVNITILHPNFLKYVDQIHLPEKMTDTIQLSVVLEWKAKLLDEVTVSAEQIFWVYPRKQTNVVDFILEPDNQILLCCSEQNNYYLRLLDPHGEKKHETVIRRNPQKLFQSCLKTVHLIYSDSIYEAYSNDHSFGFYEPVTPELFGLLTSCVYKGQNNLVNFIYSNQDQRVEYIGTNITTKLSKVLYVGENQKRTKELVQYQLKNQLDETTLMTNNHVQLGIARSRWDNKRFYEQVLGKPVYIPLFELNDSLIIFDHLNDSAVVFTKTGMRIRSFPIFYHHFNGWKNELLVDMEKTRIYARYESDGLTTLREINPTNGRTERLIPLNKHVFPEHLQIRGNFVYYLYKDYLDRSIQYLYKQALNN